MSRNGSGVYSLPAGNPVVTGTTISSSWANTTLSDIATALTGSVASDGQTPMTGNLQMGSNKVTGLAVATSTGDALSYGQAATVTDLSVTGNATVGGTLTLTGGLTLNGNVTVGDSSSDTLTVNATSTFAASATFSSTFAANGGVTLGDASGDALTINSSAVSIPNGLNFDSNTFVIDATNNRVGIGQASPAARLDLKQASDNWYSGIKLERSNSTAQYGFVSFAQGTTYVSAVDTAAAGNNVIVFGNSTDGTTLTERMRITSAGNVGIGTSSPAGKLVVSNGSSGTTVNAQADDFIVDSSSDVGISILSPDANVSRLVFGSPSDSLAAQVNWDYTNKSLYVGTATATGKLLLITGNAATAATLDSSGNLGLGVTPSSSTAKQFEIGYAGQGLSSRSGIMNYVLNGTYNSGWKYAGTGAVSNFELYNGTFAWYTAPSGTAGNAISFTQAMTLDASGNLGIGTTSPNNKLAVSYSDTNYAGGIYVTNTATTGNAWGRIDLKSANATGSFVLAQDQSGIAYVTMAGNYPMAFATNNTERMRITSSGNLLVGTSTNPSSANVRQVLATSGDTYLQIASGSTGGGLIGQAGANMLFYTYTGAVGSESYTERMRIDSSGNLLVGKTSTATTSLGWNLSPVAGNAKFDTGQYFVFNRDTNDILINFRRSDVSVGNINVTTTATAYVTSSDYRLKDNIAPMTGALATVSQLKPVTYTWKADGSTGQGFIAHELAEVVPDCVTGEKDAVELVDIKDEEGNVIGQEEKPVYQGIDTSFLVATLTAAIQELKAEVDSLKAQLNK